MRSRTPFAERKVQVVSDKKASALANKKAALSGFFVALKQ